MAEKALIPSVKNVTQISAPEICSIIESPELSISFFNKAEKEYTLGHDVRYDLSEAKEITETFVTLLIAHIKDWNINKGRASKLTLPNNEECSKKLKRLGIFKKVSQTGEEIADSNLSTTKVTNRNVANDVAKYLVDSSTLALYGKEKKIKELYALLIEIMANTNNHADSKEHAKYPWWLLTFHDEERAVIKYVFVDLGVGIFESLPVKQYFKRNPLPLLAPSSEHYKTIRGGQLTNIFQELENGRIKSSTGLSSRGKGFPLVIKSARSGHFKSFFILSNDAFIDVIKNEVSVMHEHFSGTLYYFELQENKT